ncbi:die2 alg10 family protein [Cystoisospora suis]|uniref:Dol-P-Glc:Glc(2)Man(9)GlcNAc(2)-PP-Dol alpha-1,2-glucosyltransferase n=1 Tax=Cystoisospora suis TaxID=483139 RepID=A0A2C6KL00_9APIC|nr:die2 alg10 family protein [Cystoisospora suis]
MCCSAVYFRGVNSLVISPFLLFLLWKLLFLLHPGLKKRRRRRDKRKITPEKDGISTTQEKEEKKFSCSSSLHPSPSFSLSSTGRSISHEKQSKSTIHIKSVRRQEERKEEEEEKREFVPAEMLPSAYITESCLREASEVYVSPPFNLRISQETELDSRMKISTPSASALGCMYTSHVGEQRKTGQEQYQECHTEEPLDEEREEDQEEEKSVDEKKGESTSFDVSAIESLLVSLRLLRIAFFPLLYFFNFLFYTDVLAVFFLLLSYSQLLTSKHLWGYALAGIAALLVRQSSIIWLGGCILFVFLSFIYFFSSLSSSYCSSSSFHSCPESASSSSSSSSSPSFSSSFTSKEHGAASSSFFSPVSFFLSPFFPSLPSQPGDKSQTFSSLTSIRWSKCFISVSLLLPLLLPVILFLLFIVWNGGRIAIGHQAFHQPGVHTAQLLYVTLFLMFAASPATLCRTIRRGLCFFRVAFSSLFRIGSGGSETTLRHNCRGLKDTSKKMARKRERGKEETGKNEEEGRGREEEMKSITRETLDRSSCQRKEDRTKDEEEEKMKMRCNDSRNSISPDLLERLKNRPTSHLPSSVHASSSCSAPSILHNIDSCSSSSYSCSFYLSWISFFLLFLFFSLCTGWGAVAHPFLLSDNRHYTFYLWRRFFRFSFFRFYLGPFIVTSFLVFGEVPRSLCIPPLPMSFLMSFIKKEETGGRGSLRSQKAKLPFEARGREEERSKLRRRSIEEENSLDTIMTASHVARRGEEYERKDSVGEKERFLLIEGERKRESRENDELRERRNVGSKEARICTDTAAVMIGMRCIETKETREKEAYNENRGEEEGLKHGNEKEREVDSWTLLSFLNERGGERDLRRRRKRSEIVEIVEESEELQDQGGVHTPEISGVQAGSVSSHWHSSYTDTSPSSVSLLGSAACLVSNSVDFDNEEGSNFHFSTESDLTGEMSNEVYTASQTTQASGFLEKPEKREEEEEETQSDRITVHSLLSSSIVGHKWYSLETFYSCGCLCIYTLCIVLVLVPADLFEPRYFLFILVLFLLHEKFLLSPEFYSSTPISGEYGSNTATSGRSEKDVIERGEGRMKEQTSRIFSSRLEGKRIRADGKEKRERETTGVQETSLNSSPCIRGNLSSSCDHLQGQPQTVKAIVKKSWLQPMSCLFKCMYTRRAWVGVYRGEGSGYEAALLNEFLGFLSNLVASFALIYIFVFHSFIDEDGRIARFMF